MKKALFIITFAAVLPLFAASWTDPQTSITWQYQAVDGGVTIKSSYSYQSAIDSSILGSLTIPAEIANKKVICIGKYAFYDCGGLTSITIPDSVTSILGAAFSFCSGLSSVTIPSSVTNIGNSAFSSCSGLKSISIPNSVTSIDVYAFKKCSGLTSVVIPSSVANIGSYVFDSCSGLTSVTIPSSVTNIGTHAFYECSGLTSVAIPNSVTSIGSSAFSWCSGLSAVTIPNSVTSIGSSVFRGCSGLTSVTIPSSVTSIGDDMFRGCSGLTSVTVSSSVTNIGTWAFYGCSGLTSVDFEGRPPSNLKNASINVNSAVRYNIAYEDEWLPVIAQCGFKNAVAYNPAVLPNLVDPTFQEILEVLEQATDTKLATQITNGTEYAVFRIWAGKVKVPGGETAGTLGVMSAPNAWFSYALGQDTLLNAPPTDDDLKVEAFQPTAESGKFDFTVSLKDIDIGSDAAKENLKKVFGLEGASTLENTAFSSNNVDIEFGTPVNGKVKFTAGPKDTTQKAFFMKVKLLP